MSDDMVVPRVPGRSSDGARVARAAALTVLAVVLLAGCAAGANEAAGSADPSGDIAGFWLGLWHGFISPITFIVSLFNENVGIYEVHNNGGWYDFGFVFGVSIFFGGAGGSSRGGRKARGSR